MGLELDVSNGNFDAVITWMRKRGVIAMKIGENAFTLGSLSEPEDTPVKTVAMTPEQANAAKRKEHEENFYGVPARPKVT
jgi:hypothetical protein